MKLLFKQRFFSWFDSYDVYNEAGEAVYTVAGQISWGHCLKVFDANGNELATLKEKVFAFLPQFDIYINDTCVGCIKKEFTFFKPKFHISFNNWNVEGSLWEWDYNVIDSRGETVATVSKEIFKLTDTYVIYVENPADALNALMLVLAIDAEKCSRN